MEAEKGDEVFRQDDYNHDRREQEERRHHGKEDVGVDSVQVPASQGSHQRGLDQAAGLRPQDQPRRQDCLCGLFS